MENYTTCSNCGDLYVGNCTWRIIRRGEPYDVDTQRRNFSDELHEALRESLHLSFVTGDQGFLSEQQLATFFVVSLVFSLTPTHLKAVLTSG